MTVFPGACVADDPKTSCRFFRTAVKPGSAGKVEPFIHPEVSDTDYGIQHIKDKLPIGVALSGGGFRAATCAVGFMRGLHNLTLSDGSTFLSRVQYLSSTSGGSWFNAAFSYQAPGQQQDELKIFLGPYLEAAQLTVEQLKESPPDGSFEWAIAKHNELDGLLWDTLKTLVPTKKVYDLLGAAAKWLLQKKCDSKEDPRKQPTWVHPWTEAVTETFLKPFNLHIYEDCTVSAGGTAGGIHRRAEQAATHVLLACSDPKRPYPILTGTVCNGVTDDGKPMYPLEFAPLYFGTAAAFPDSKPPLGGGFVEPWGLNAEPVQCRLDCAGDGCTGTVQLKRKGHTVPLAQAVAISSGFLASAVHDSKIDAVKGMLSTEELINFGVLKDGGVEHQKMGFADGGSLDNYAIMPLLRRGVKCIIVLVAASTPPDGTWQSFRDESSDIAALFGAANTNSITPGITAGMLNDMCHVFGRDGLEGEVHFRKLFQDLHDKLRKGQPGFHCAEYPIRENSFFHIPARDEPVTVMWIYNQQYAGWEAQLPTETYRMLQSQRGYAVHHQGAPIEREPNPLEKCAEELFQLFRGQAFKQTKLNRFPYFTTLLLDWDNTPVRLLSQMHTAIVMHDDVKEAIQGLLDKACGQSGPGSQPPPSSSNSSVSDDAEPPLTPSPISSSMLLAAAAPSHMTRRGHPEAAAALW